VVFDLKDFDERTLRDRRAGSTPALSGFTFYGRRKSFRREADRQRGGYTDRYTPGLLSCLVLILGLNVLDALFTLTILNAGGCEINFVVGLAIDLWADKFWIWKFGLSSACVILLCLHSNFRFVGKAILGITVTYVMLAIYQFLILLRL
jgi:hypothetical protein